MLKHYLCIKSWYRIFTYKIQVIRVKISFSYKVSDTGNRVTLFGDSCGIQFWICIPASDRNQILYLYIYRYKVYI